VAHEAATAIRFNHGFGSWCCYPMSLVDYVKNLPRMQQELFWFGSWLMLGHAGPLGVEVSDFIDDRLSMLWGILESEAYDVFRADNSIDAPRLKAMLMENGAYEIVGGALTLAKAVNTGKSLKDDELRMLAEVIFGPRPEHFGSIPFG